MVIEKYLSKNMILTKKNILITGGAGNNV